MSDIATWPTRIDNAGRLHWPIRENWLRAHGFRICDGRNDLRLPIRRIHVALDGVDGRQMFEDATDLCIDVAPVASTWDTLDKTWREWHVWVAQDEPYRLIHVRHMRYTWELARLYEGLTGRVWPGALDSTDAAADDRR